MRYIKLSRPNQIELPRGDSETYDVGIVINGEEYTPAEGDAVRFALRKEKYHPIMVKEIPISTMQLHFEPEDTKNLPFGKYVYDMQITFADGSVKTFIKTAPFIITEEVE